MKSNKYLELTDANFQAEVRRQQGLMLVDFWADWCGPCHLIAPVIEELPAAYEGRIRVGKLNIDEHPVTTQEYRIQSIPTLIFFKDGKEVDRIIGAIPKRELTAKVDKMIQT